MWTVEVKTGGKWIVLVRSEKPSDVRDLGEILRRMGVPHRETYNPPKLVQEAN